MAMLISFTAIMPEGSDRSLLESIWNVLMHAIDTGNVAADKGWRFRLAMLIVTFGGIFGVSTLIGIVSSGIDAKIKNLRRGRSRVIEMDHIVILGWSLPVFTLISELALANANRPDTCIVILSEENKVEMEDKLHRPVNFYTVVEAAKQRSESAIGYCRQVDANNMAKSYGVVLNPQKDRLITFAPQDPIIVLAES